MPPNWGRLVRAVKDKARWDGWKCRLCGKPDPKGQVDHLVPHFEGGSDDLTNLQWLCRNCHKAKSIAESIRSRRRKRD